MSATRRIDWLNTPQYIFILRSAGAFLARLLRLAFFLAVFLAVFSFSSAASASARFSLILTVLRAIGL